MVMPIRVMRPATPAQLLESAKVYLGAYGPTELSNTPERLKLSFARVDSGNDPRYPLSNNGTISMVFDERRHTWECISNLYGVPVKMGDPKLFAFNVKSMVEDRIGAKKQLMAKVQEFWQRYNGDHVHFANRLGKDMVNTGVMTIVEDGGPVFAHFHNTFDTSFDVWFSATQPEVAGTILPIYRFGFYPQVQLQPFELSVAGAQDVINALDQQAAAVSNFLNPLIEIF